MPKSINRIFFTTIRWTARIMGVLLATIFLFFLIGEGVPKPSDITTRAMWMFVGVFMEIGGLLIAWRFEAIGATIALAGYLFFSLLEGGFWVPPIYPLFPIAAVLFLICAFEGKILKQSPKSTIDT